MNMRTIGRRVAVTASAAAAATGIVLGGAGVASADTSHGEVWSSNCSGNFMASYNGGWQVYNSIINNSRTANCAGWIDVTWNGNTSSWDGLLGYTGVLPGQRNTSFPQPDNSPALARACIQASDDAHARCTGWW